MSAILPYKARKKLAYKKVKTVTVSYQLQSPFKH